MHKFCVVLLSLNPVLECTSGSRCWPFSDRPTGPRSCTSRGLLRWQEYWVHSSNCQIRRQRQRQAISRVPSKSNTFKSSFKSSLASPVAVQASRPPHHQRIGRPLLSCSHHCSRYAVDESILLGQLLYMYALRYMFETTAWLSSI